MCHVIESLSNHGLAGDMYSNGCREAAKAPPAVKKADMTSDGCDAPGENRGRLGVQNALMPVSSRPIVSWWIVSVPS